MYNDKLEQRKNEILQELDCNVYDENWDYISFKVKGDNDVFRFDKGNFRDKIIFVTILSYNPKQLRLIAELYEVMQYLGEV